MTPSDFHLLKVTLAAVGRTDCRVPRLEAGSWLGGYYKIQAREDAGSDYGGTGGSREKGSNSGTILEGKLPYSTCAGLKPKFAI